MQVARRKFTGCQLWAAQTLLAMMWRNLLQYYCRTFEAMSAVFFLFPIHVKILGATMHVTALIWR
jgi:hypothetical protein